MLGFDLTAVTSLQRFQMQFEDLDKIGTGGFSTVSKVRNKRDRKIYALKTIKIKPSQWKGSVCQHIERVLSQGKILSTLKHPNVLRYYCCWISADLSTQQELAADTQQSAEQQAQLQLIIDELSSSNSYGFQFQRRSQSLEKKKNVSKNIRNQKYDDAENDNLFGVNLLKFRQIRIHFLSQLGQYSLQKHISLRNSQSRKTLQQKRLIKIQNYKIILDIIEGLNYIHNEKIIHRDIKLQNIILNNKQCKIIDFGLAKRVKKGNSLNAQNCLFQIDLEGQSNQQRHSSSVGTKIFSSPQQRNSQYYDYRTDIYSLAMVIGLIFSQYQTQHQQKQVLQQLRSRSLDTFDIDQRLKVILYRCLGEQKSRAELKQIKTIIKILLKEQLQKDSQNKQKAFKRISYKKNNDQNTEAKDTRKILIQKHFQNVILNEEKKEIK